MEERQERKENKLAPLYGGAAYSVNVIIYLVLSLLVSAVITSLSARETGAAKYALLLVSPIAVAITTVIFFRVTREPVKKILPVKTQPKYYLLGVLLIFGLLFSLNSLNELLVKLFELWGYERKPSNLPSFAGWNVAPALLFIALLPAIAEEILFRGIVLQCAERGAGSVLAIVFGGLCFSLYHGSVEQTAYQFVCGCLFGLLAVRARSIGPTVVIHFLNNAVIIILSACGFTDAATGELILPYAAYVTLTVLSAISLAVALVWLVFGKTEITKREKGGVVKFLIGAAIGVLSMIILWVANLVV